MALNDRADVPFVSVIVPVFNSAGTIEACLRSLLAQDYPHGRYEVIVVDNNSTDGTAAIVTRYPVRSVVERQTQSSYAARNRGIRAATGGIIAFTDADCVASTGWIRSGVAAFSDDRIGGVAGTIRPCQPKTVAQRYAVEKQALSQEGALRQNSYRPAVYTASAFYRASALQQAGLFDPAVKSGGDADLAWRVQERLGLRIAYCPEAAVYHEHRRSVRELLRQRRNYGYGSVVNYVKYRRQMGPRTLRHAYWELLALERIAARLAGAVWRVAVSLGRDRDARQQVVLEGVDVLVFFARKSGQWRAALEHRVWYV